MPTLMFEDLKKLLYEKLIKNGFSENDGELCAHIFATNSLYGVLSHGVNRYPSFIELIAEGAIKVDAKPELIDSFNAIQRWDANYGPGPLNANFITDKVLELSDEYGIGCIGLRNSNHWMRPGYFGWKAVERGYIYICWTNTIPVLPAYGADEPRLGNNPIVLAVPRKDKPVVLDMAMSQFSYGSLATYRREGKKLLIKGGYDSSGNETDDPGEIYNSKMPFPIGHWKGSGLALLLDLISAVISGGRSTYDLSKIEHDSGMSQTFIAINPNKFSSTEAIETTVNNVIEYYKDARTREGMNVFYPGENALNNKEDYLKNGIPVSDEIFERIKQL